MGLRAGDHGELERRLRKKLLLLRGPDETGNASFPDAEGRPPAAFPGLGGHALWGGCNSCQNFSFCKIGMLALQAAWAAAPARPHFVRMVTKLTAPRADRFSLRPGWGLSSRNSLGDGKRQAALVQGDLAAILSRAVECG